LSAAQTMASTEIGIIARTAGGKSAASVMDGSFTLYLVGCPTFRTLEAAYFGALTCSPTSYSRPAGVG
jgi:hypothetical protein